ncbi:Polyketide synthase PksJ [compost metagenome]
MSAPTYPFAQERIQIPRSNAKRVTAGAVATTEEQRQVSYLHPLLHLNTSDLLEQRFSSTFTGKEFFLADHVVRGNPVLPGVAYLEMARTAIQHSQGRSQLERTGIRLKHVVWIQPIVSDGMPAEVHIGLFPEADGRIGYEIYSHSAVDDSEIVHGQGTAEWMEESQPLTWDLHELLRRCKAGELSSTDFYEEARGLGISFGAGFQGIQSLYAGEREVLSKLVLPAAVVKTRDSYVLHPSMLDAALQTATICIMRGGAGHKLLLPFALEELEVYGPCTSEMWAYARFSKGNRAGDAVQRVDVDLCDESGALRVKIKGFTARVLEGGVQAVADSSSKIERLLLEPIWVERPAASEQPIYEFEKHLIFLCDTAAVARDRIRSQLPDAEVFCLDSGTGTPSMRFEAYAGEMFEHIKAILQSKPEGNLLIQTVVCHQGEEQIYSGLTGLLKTAGLEYSKLSGQLIEISRDPHHADMLAMLKDNAMQPGDKHIRYADGKRYVAEWCELDQKLVKDAGVPWRDRGVYLITGGAGRLGLLFAKEIGERVSQATVILTGRGALREDQEQQVVRLRGMQLHVAYKQLDATDSEAVQRLIGEIVAEYGHLDGIIHGAGIIQDNIIIKKTREELDDVMAPKVSGLVHLDEASRELPLDFFFVFSSISGSLGNPGQADYATANAFMDAYMGYRNELTQKSLRSGAALSVNWPLWKDGGMQVDVETEKLMMQNLGLVPMQTYSGIQALYDAYASGKTQVIVVEGNRHKIKQKLLTAPISKPIKGNRSGADGNHSGVKNGDQQSELQISLKQMVSDLLKVSLQDLDADTELGEYGFDSISYTVFANQINTAYTFELAPTVFFEYGTLRSLTEFLVREYGDVMNSRQASAQPDIVTNVEVDSGPASTDVSDAGVNRISKRRKNRFTQPEQPDKTAAFEPIAIIGISGKFPGAADIDEFWTNLIDEKDCITEIPQDRWNWQEYDGDPANEINKTNVKWGGFIEGVDEFDPLFFGISPREAQFIDPQQRLLMTYAWKAIEDAGICPQSLSGTSTGVFVGTGNTGYKDLFHKADLPIEGHSTMGNMIPSVGPNRLSYFLNVHGPSEPVETACSSSLVAIHRAASAIQMGDCEMAIAGGVNTTVTPEAHISYSKAGMLSVDGRCRTFSSRADGYVRGEGVGIIVLKKLKDAERDRNPIYGVIRGTAENHGGRANTLTSPNPKAQAELLIKAYKKAGVDPRTVTYIEAHGTGTELGDPIEINGLKAAFKELYATSGDSGMEDHRCGLGSVKSNIGHLELAAGISGVIKILLQMKHKTLVKSLHTETLNPYLQLKDSPFYIVQNTEDWKTVQDKQGRELPRLAGVSSFGIGGVNAHIVIEEYLPNEEEPSTWNPTPQDPAIIVLSAKNEKSLREQAEQLLMSIRMRKVDENDLSRIAYTLQVGRNSMEERLALIVGSMSELVEKLEDFLQGKSSAEQSYRGKANRNNETLTLISADEDMALAIDSWIVKRKYARLAEIWVKGLHIDWNKLYGDAAPRLISLPTYPFAKERYWIPEYLQAGGDTNNVLPAGDKEVSDSSPEQRTTCLLAKSWVPCPSVTKTKSHRIVAILTYPETEPLVKRVAEHFPQHQIIYAQQAEQFLDSDWKSFDGVVDLAGCGSSGYETRSWIEWLQSLIEHGHKEGIMLLGVTQGLESYLNPAAINLTGAARAGLYRMLQSEYGHLRSRHMDADLSIDDQVLAQQIADEYFADSEEAEVCYRNGMRFRCLLEEQGESDEAAMTPESFPQDQALLITGGTRGLGALCARHFVRHYGVKRLVLTGREELPPRETWDDYLAADTPLSQKIQAVRELEAQGVQVQVLALRLSERSAVRREVDNIKRTLGPIGGVLHCAGLTDMTTLAFIRKTDAEIQEVLEPKIAGLNTLYDELRGEPLKFFVLFSSVSAIIPSLSAGQGDYAMANAYMDYFAEAVRDAGPVVSIQWPNWKEAGMGEVTNRVYKESGLLSISNAEGLQLLDGILKRKGSPVVLPARVDRSKWSPERLMQRSLHQAGGEDRTIRQPAVSVVSDPAATPGQEGANLVLALTENWLLGMFAEELRIDPSHLAIDEPFHEYGVDSIILAQLLQRINRKIAVNLDPSILYEYPTIQRFSSWLSESYPAALGLIAEESVAEQPRMKERELAERVIPAQSRNPMNEDAKDLLPSPARSEDIAIVGLSCRFAGAETLEAYWKLLSEGRSAIRSVPPERWGHPASFYAGVLDGVSQFDPAFFLIPEEDAKAMDPQALVALEECLKLWHHAGYTFEEMKGKAVGVYLGGRSHHKPGEESLLEARNPIVAVGQNYLAANLSQFFDLRGPSVVLDTACSSAIVGMNMAVQALRSGDIESAVVGGISLLETDAVHRLFQQRGILSEATSFHVFDERANGVVLGEGVGMVLLKTVDQALKDGDTIYAVVKAVALNNDGRTAGPATPNLQAQKDVMQAALAKGGKRPEEISYIEANGSGSTVTDLLELKAIQSVYRSANTAPLGLGSVKPNIGHPLCAEGIASLIKVVLMLKHRQLVPFLSGEREMTHFDRKAAGFSFYHELIEWPSPAPVAAINCFADGGTNAHVIVEAWQGAEDQVVKRRPLPAPELNKRLIPHRDTESMIAKPKVQPLPEGMVNIWNAYEVEV